jgi:LPXTG-motif cell wall-anchored protein
MILQKCEVLKMKSKLFKVIILYSCIALTVVFLPIGNTGAVESPVEIDIATSPSEYLFIVGNMKPGDWANRVITVKNSGNKDFDYATEAKYESGSETLYNQLDLQVSDANGLLFDGKLSDLKGLDTRSLASLSEEKLTFNVLFPSESGNEFQGLATEVALIFTAEAEPGENPPEENGGGTPPADNNTGGNNSDDDSFLGSVLPQTGETNPLYYYLSGLAMVLAGIIAFKAKKLTVNDDD